VRAYPEQPGRRFATVGHDMLLVVLLLLLAWLGLKVHDAVDQLAVLGSGVKKVGDTVPVVGGPVSDLGQQGEDSVLLRGSDDPQRRRVLAQRAAFSLPYGRLLQYTEDPLGDLAAERYDPLVAAALDDAGLRAR
jgi:hypothetical protein